MSNEAKRLSAKSTSPLSTRKQPQQLEKSSQKIISILKEFKAVYPLSNDFPDQEEFSPVKAKKTQSKSPLRDTLKPQVPLGMSQKLSEPKERSKTPNEFLATTPKVNKNSQKLDTMLNTSKKKRWEHLYQLKDLKLEKFKERQLQKELNEEQELKECTFCPKTYSKKPRKPQQAHERLLNWGKIKEIRNNAKKNQQSQLELESCTFSPVINRYPDDYETFEERQLRALERKKAFESPLRNKLNTTHDISKQDFSKALERLHKELHSFKI